MDHYAVIDTNVIVSALLSSHDDSAVVIVFNMLINGDIIPIYSDDILTEYSNVLFREKFSFNPDMVSYIIALIIERGIKVEPQPSYIDLPDKKDIVFYEALLATQDKNSVLITGNIKHFPNEPNILLAADYLKGIITNGY